ncbi:probable WRKY transcription factor protein 1 [Saccostrea cucullata]|uniref:probable WRKY transcription factor protein 1 n=1 Tax=Saccostrea cuccullata TaxID=36930 RepID=UPI002ED125DE
MLGSTNQLSKSIKKDFRTLTVTPNPLENTNPFSKMQIYVKLTVVTLIEFAACGHGSLNNLDKQLQNILQHYRGGISQSLSERLQKIIRSKVQVPNHVKNTQREASTNKTQLENVNGNENKTKEQLKKLPAVRKGNSKMVTASDATERTSKGVQRLVRTNKTDIDSRFKKRTIIKITDSNSQNRKNEKKAKIESHVDGKVNTVRKSFDTQVTTDHINTNSIADHGNTSVTEVHVTQHDGYVKKHLQTEKKPIIDKNSNSSQKSDCATEKQNVPNLNLQMRKNKSDIDQQTPQMQNHPRVPITEIKNIPSTPSSSNMPNFERKKHLPTKKHSSGTTEYHQVPNSGNHHNLSMSKVNSSFYMKEHLPKIPTHRNNSGMSIMGNRQPGLPIAKRKIDLSTKRHFRETIKYDQVHNGEKPNDKPIFEEKNSLSIKEDILKTPTSHQMSTMGKRHDLPIPKAKSVTFRNEHVTKTTKNQQISSLENKNSNFNPQYRSENIRFSQFSSLSRNHPANVFSEKEYTGELPHRQFKRNHDRFVKPRSPVPRKTKQELSTSIFTFSLPKQVHEHEQMKHRRSFNPVFRQNKKKFSLTPSENQIIRPRSFGIGSIQGKGMLTNKPTTQVTNSWKRPVPETHVAWENIPKQNTQISQPPNAMYDQQNLQSSNNYYFDNINQETLPVERQYPQNSPGQLPGMSSFHNEQTWNKEFSSGSNNQLQHQNQQNPDRLTISFQGSNKPDKTKTLIGSNEPFSNSRINNNGKRPRVTRTGNLSGIKSGLLNIDMYVPGTQKERKFSSQKWPSKPSVVYSKFQDNSQKIFLKSRQQSSPQKTRKDKNSQSKQRFNHPSVVYSSFRDNSQKQNWDTQNHWNKPNGIRSQSFNDNTVTHTNNNFIHITTSSPYFYPTSSPSMYVPPNKPDSQQIHTFTRNKARAGQNRGWNGITTPLYDKQKSVKYSKFGDASFYNHKPNQMTTPSEITIAPNFLFNQPPKSQQSSQYRLNSNSQNSVRGMPLYEERKINQNTWYYSSTIPPTQAPVPTTYQNAFMIEEMYATKAPNEWTRAGIDNRNIENQYIYSTKTPMDNQQQQYQNQQMHQQNNNNQQFKTQHDVYQQQSIQSNQQNGQQMNQDFQTRQTYPQKYKETQLNNQDFSSNPGQFQTQNEKTSQTKSFFNQQQTPNNKISNENPSLVQKQHFNGQQTEYFGQQQQALSNQQQSSQHQNQQFNQGQQNSFQKYEKSSLQQNESFGRQTQSQQPNQYQNEKTGNLQNKRQKQVVDQTTGEIGYQQQNLPEIQQNQQPNQQQNRVNQQQNLFGNQRYQQPIHQQTGGTPRKQQNSLDSNPSVQQQNRQPDQQFQNSFGNPHQQNNQSQTVHMGQQQQNLNGIQQQQPTEHQNTQGNSPQNKNHLKPSDQPQQENKFNPNQQMYSVQQQQSNSLQNNQQNTRFPQQMQDQQQVNGFLSNQQGQSFQHQQQQNQQPVNQQPSNNGRNMDNNFQINTRQERRRPKNIPAPAYLTFGVYYPDGTTTEEEHELLSKSIHTITTYDAENSSLISDYLTMDHGWNTFGLVSQGSNADTCYVGKLQPDLMKSFEEMVNKTRFSDIPFIEANSNSFAYTEVRQIDYNQAVYEVGGFVSDSCGGRANIFLVERPRHGRFKAGRMFIPPTACSFGPPQQRMNNGLLKCSMGTCRGNYSCNTKYNICCPKRPNNTRCRKMSIGKFCVIHAPQYGYYPG